MKNRLLILILGLSLNSSAQVVDKVAHFGVGYVTGAVSSGITLTNSNGKNEWLKSLSVGIGSSLALGIGKEVYDYYDYGKFDFKDLGATVLGGALGSVTIKISINRYERKHLI